MKSVGSPSIRTDVINYCDDMLKIFKNKSLELRCFQDSVEEWSKVPTVLTSSVQLNNEVVSPVVSIDEAVLYFKTFDFTKTAGKTLPEKRKFCELFRWMKSPHLQEELSAESDFINSLTQCSLDWADGMQCRILQTIFRCLTGARLDCPLRGTHWQLIGFQGNDPATDLRGVGLFGLLQFLYLTCDQMLPLGLKLYKVANSESQPFPLAVLSLNLTNIVLNVFNTGKLNRECNARKSVINTVNSFYAALLIYTFNIWVTQKKTIKDSGYILKDAEKYCCRNIRKVLKELPKHLQKYDISNVNTVC
ncbi:ELMO domain-containing protein 3-like isoform X2 [Rhodnius prolixus]